MNLTFNNKPCSTREYSSLNVLEGKTISRGDDLESILYVIIELYKNKIPWDNIEDYNINFFANSLDLKEKLKKINVKTKSDKINMVEDIKNKIKREERLSIENIIFLHYYIEKEQLFSGLPSEFVKIYEIIKKLKYWERPNYDLIIDVLEKAKLRLFQESGNILESERFEGKEIQFKYCWERIFFEICFKNKQLENKEARDEFDKFTRKFCLNFPEYVKSIFNLGNQLG